jgi:hypothetical protein
MKKDVCSILNIKYRNERGNPTYPIPKKWLHRKPKKMPGVHARGLLKKTGVGGNLCAAATFLRTLCIAQATKQFHSLMKIKLTYYPKTVTLKNSQHSRIRLET